jgi:abortive infection bacteriophage resistance protein
MQYNKPFKSIQEQIQLLQERGLIIDDNGNPWGKLVRRFIFQRF